MSLSLDVARARAGNLVGVFLATVGQRDAETNVKRGAREPANDRALSLIAY